MSKKFLLSAIFAAGVVGGSAVAGDMQVLNEEELEEVSAQGFQTIDNDTRNFGGANDQENNLDSVQMNDDAQLNARAADLIAAATSSVNAAINILWSDAIDDSALPESGVPVVDGTSVFTPVVTIRPSSPNGYGTSYDQDNIQTARNHDNYAGDGEVTTTVWDPNANDGDGGYVEVTGYVESNDADAYNTNKETQIITNNVYNNDNVKGQDNNNNSVQLNDSAQANAVGLYMENSAQSASNNALNVFASNISGLTSGTQDNTQTAKNMTNTAQAAAGAADAHNGEEGSATQTVTNVAWQENTDGTKTLQAIKVEDQDNNNNSVQLNDNAQQNANALTINNNANSAKNFGVNIHASLGTLDASNLSQTNTQTADNHGNTAIASADANAYNTNKETQNIFNGADADYNTDNGDSPIKVDGYEIKDQNNNNNSVQLNGGTDKDGSVYGAQENAVGLEIRNSAISAYNTGINLMYFENSSNNTTLSQTNTQIAKNMSNVAESEEGNANAYNGEWAGDENIPTQYVDINANIYDQDNNNNSTQLNDGAQKSAKGLIIVNNANSAQNSGLNILVDGGDSSSSNGGTNGGTNGGSKSIASTTVTQTNTQNADNHINYAEGSTTATAKNINKQSQEIRNADDVDVSNNAPQAVIDGNNNNNNSTQLNDEAQRYANALEITNMAVSAANTGFNIAILHDVTNSTVNQTNDQTARNFENSAIAVSVSESTDTTTDYTVTPSGTATAKNGELAENAGQYIYNEHAQVDDQDNNNNSVQLNDNAQESASALSIANIAKVALNSGFNVVWIEGTTSDASITQENIQYAGNHNNYAVGSTAFAMNETKQNQLIENCYCADINDQNNNQNSVQVNDSAQANVTGWHVVNGATSAINVATNLMVTTGTVSGTTLTQKNEQNAVNFSNAAIGIEAAAGNLR